MAKALYLTGDVEQAWPLLRETSFGDNGGEPDGNAWLQTEYDEEDAQRVIDAGLGKIVEVKRASVAAMARFCGFAYDEAAFADSHERNDWLRDQLFPTVDDKTAAWAYYDADERFIFVEAE